MTAPIVTAATSESVDEVSTSAAPYQSSVPRVSVIMPCYNTSPYIAEAIESVLSQDYPAIELIIVDDGSSDSTVEIVRSFGARVRLLQQQNQGAAVARNTGLDAATGEFIAFLDSDDLWLPGKLSSQLAYMQAHPNIGMTYTRWQVWQPDERGEFVLPEITKRTDTRTALLPSAVPERSGWLYNRLLFSSMLHTITVMARRSLIERVGRFDPALKRGQDYDYWIRSSRETEIHQLDRTLALYRIHGNGCATKWPNENYESIVVQKALSRWGLVGPTGECTPAKDVRKRLADTCFSFGYYHYWEGNPSLARNAFLEAARKNPARLSAWRYLLMSAFRHMTRRSGPVVR